MDGPMAYTLRAVEHVETHLNEALTLEGIATAVRCSPYHLHRMFRDTVGHPPGAYVRMRRLSLAVAALRDTRCSIAAIAADVGFGHRQSLTRAFRRQYGFSPEILRSRDCAVPILPRFTPRGSIGLEGGLLLEPRFENRGGFRIAGVPCRIDHRRNLESSTARTAALDFLDMARRSLTGYDPDLYIGHVDESEGSRFHARYMPSVVLSDDATPGSGFTCLRIPSGPYAVFSYMGTHAPEALTFNRLVSLYAAIEAEWIPAWRGRIAGDWHYERLDFSVCRPGHVELDILYPLRRSAER